MISPWFRMNGNAIFNVAMSVPENGNPVFTALSFKNSWLKKFHVNLFDRNS
jgi:hypothetical protein